MRTRAEDAMYRYQSMSELLDAYDQVVKDRPVSEPRRDLAPVPVARRLHYWEHPRFITAAVGGLMGLGVAQILILFISP